jgi:hypothetical protein
VWPHSRAPQQSDPSAVAHGCNAFPQQTRPAVVIPQTNVPQQSDVLAQAATAPLQTGGPPAMPDPPPESL